MIWNDAAAKSSAAEAPTVNPLTAAKWTWFDEGDPAASAPVGKRYFRRAVALPEGTKIKSASVSLAADNAFDLFVNGQAVGSGDNFNLVAEFEIAPLLKPGTNVLAVSAENGGPNPNPAGLIAAIEIRLASGETIRLNTDREWLAATNAGEGWRTQPSADAAWKPARELGPWGMAPWGKVRKPVAEPEVYPDYAQLSAILRATALPPDFESDGPLRYTHRRGRMGTIYFVANASAEAVTAKAAFRVKGKVPELWDPLTGEIRKASDWEERGWQTVVPLKLEAHDSVFVVFRESGKPPRAGKAKRNWDDFATIQEIAGSWEVRFQPGRGAPEKIALPTLADWSKHSDAGVRHYSGVATYRKTFDWRPQLSAIGNQESPVFLDLGRVEVMARVRLNSKDVGTAWKEPFRVEITKALKPGENQLEVELANLWPNRLIGDAGLPAEQRIAWTPWNPFAADTPLLESGLLGPVRLVTTRDSARSNGGTPSARSFFAFCMDTHDERKRSLAEQAALLKELGYDGAGHLWLDGLEERLGTLDAAGLRLFQVYLRADISPGAKQAYDSRLGEKLPLLKDRNAMVAVLVTGGKPSDDSQDDRAVAILRELADLARPHGVRVALYPHVNDWLERVEDAVRLAQKVQRPNLGVMFNLCHWLKVGEESQLKSVLQAAKPHLLAVSLNGSDHAADIRAGTGQWIAPLDTGAFDQRALLRALDEVGFPGPVGLQCYGIPGDARVHLERSMNAWRRLNEQEFPRR